MFCANNTVSSYSVLGNLQAVNIHVLMGKHGHFHQEDIIKALPLNENLQAFSGCWNRENLFSPGMSTMADYSIK